MTRALYDISPPVGPSLAVFPGDTPLTREVLLDMAKGDSMTLSTLHSTVHLGSHLDAPSHYGRDGETIDVRPLELFVGPARLIRLAIERGGMITVAAVESALTADEQTVAGDELPERVLLATGTYPDPSFFNLDYAPMDPRLVDWLSNRGVRLVGVDTPSFDSSDSKDLPAHNAMLRNDMNILEGLVLDGVPGGIYELIALPLRLVGFDGSPVRAVLREL